MNAILKSVAPSAPMGLIEYAYIDQIKIPNSVISTPSFVAAFFDNQPVAGAAGERYALSCENEHNVTSVKAL